MHCELLTLLETLAVSFLYQGRSAINRSCVRTVRNSLPFAVRTGKLVCSDASPGPVSVSSIRSLATHLGGLSPDSSLTLAATMVDMRMYGRYALSIIDFVRFWLSGSVHAPKARGAGFNSQCRQIFSTSFFKSTLKAVAAKVVS